MLPPIGSGASEAICRASVKVGPGNAARVGIRCSADMWQRRSTSREKRPGSIPFLALPPTPSAMPKMPRRSSKKKASSPPFPAFSGCGMLCAPNTTCRLDAPGTRRSSIGSNRRCGRAPMVARCTPQSIQSSDSLRRGFIFEENSRFPYSSYHFFPRSGVNFAHRFRGRFRGRQ